MSSPANTNAFLSSLRPHLDKPLVFEYDDRRIQAGYHVTEIKAASYQSLDCGANLEVWRETVVQLWDVPGKEGETFMNVGKFLSIYDKVAARLPLGPDAKVVFECGDTSSPAIRYTAENLEVKNDAVVVHLTPVQATCKPRDRWLASLGVTAAVPAAATGGYCSPQPVPASSSSEQSAPGCCSVEGSL